jgi:CRP-like cAMP-binding protein
VIFPQGQIADGAYVVISGLIGLKKKHHSENIIEHIGEISKGDTFGAWYILFESNLRQISAEATENSEVVFIPNDLLKQKLSKCDPFIIYCFRKWIDLISNKKVPKTNTLIKNDPKF